MWIAWPNSISAPIAKRRRGGQGPDRQHRAQAAMDEDHRQHIAQIGPHEAIPDMERDQHFHHQQQRRDDRVARAPGHQPLRSAMCRSITWPSTVIGTLPPSTTASLNARKS